MSVWIIGCARDKAGKQCCSDRSSQVLSHHRHAPPRRGDRAMRRQTVGSPGMAIEE
ncbi:hypothetical protein [Pseudomonas sp.]|uniref:hypothetical protein n=1 Tax=Pseudomonas sp. TaxID=306 RepID=UPI003D0FACDF